MHAVTSGTRGNQSVLAKTKRDSLRHSPTHTSQSSLVSVGPFLKMCIIAESLTDRGILAVTPAFRKLPQRAACAESNGCRYPAPNRRTMTSVPPAPPILLAPILPRAYAEIEESPVLRNGAFAFGRFPSLRVLLSHWKGRRSLLPPRCAAIGGGEAADLQGGSIPCLKQRRRRNRRSVAQRPETLKIEGRWQDAVKKSLAKKKSPEGWPK